MTKVTKHLIHYKSASWRADMNIPAGTAVIPATNLPYEGKYWVEPWEGLTAFQESDIRNYGILVDESEVEEVSE